MTRAGSSSVARLAQRRQERLREQERALDVDVEQLVERVLGVLVERRAPGGAGVVDQHVEIGRCARRPRRPARRRRPGSTGRPGSRRTMPGASRRVQLGGRRVAGLGLAGRDVDGRAGLDEAGGDHAADAPRAAGDDDLLSRRLRTDDPGFRSWRREPRPLACAVRPHRPAGVAGAGRGRRVPRGASPGWMSGSGTPKPGFFGDARSDLVDLVLDLSEPGIICVLGRVVGDVVGHVGSSRSVGDAVSSRSERRCPSVSSGHHRLARGADQVAQSRRVPVVRRAS